MHVAVILPRWVGDAVMATPLLRGLRSHLGASARITGVLRPVVADLLADSGWLDACILYDRHSRKPDRCFSAAVRGLRADPVDVAFVLPDSASAAAVAWCAGARRRIGIGSGLHRLLLTDALPAAARAEIVPPPVAFLRIGAALGLPPQPIHLELAVSAADERRGDETLARLFPGQDGPLVILNDNSANGVTRAWGAENHAALARWLVARVPGCRVLMHCGPGDRATAAAVVTAVASPAVQGLDAVEDLSIGLSKAVYRRATAAVSSDSGPRHIAAAFGVPTVALIGPTDPRSGRSDERRCTEIRHDLPCSPCEKEVCPLRHHDCMRLISVDEVGQAVLALLDREHAAARPGLTC
jgi:heptosyltransferase-2